jgi:hypothetical protein
MVKFENMLNKPLASVSLPGDKGTIVFRFKDGTSRAFGVEGGSCSRSWIEHLETPDSVDGAIIQSVEDGGGVPWDGHKCKRKVCRHDCLEVYNTKFRTDRGDIVLEYRNDSNGHYGGNLVNAHVPK